MSERDLIAAVLDGEAVDEDGLVDQDGLVEEPAVTFDSLVERWDALVAWRKEQLDPRRHVIAHTIVAITIVIFCVAFIRLAVINHRNFGTGHFDTGVFDQATHLLAHGKQFMSGRGLNVFGHHANFGLYLFAPFYWIGWGGPILLNSAMTVSLAFAAVPVYLIARDRTESVALAATIALAFLAHFSVSSTINEGFHPESMAVLPLFAAFLFAERAQWRWYAASLAYAVCWKEDISLFVAMLGVYLFFTRSRTVGLVTAFAGGIYFLVITSIVVPGFAGAGTTFYGGDYGTLGDSALEVAFNAALFERDETFRLLENNGARDYFFDLGQPYGWLSYLSPLWMLLSLPQFAANLLNIHGLAANPFAHYVSVPLVALTLGLIATFANRKNVLVRVGMALWMVVFALNTSVSRGYMPYSDNYETGGWQLYENERTLRMRGAVGLIPSDAAVVATYNIAPHLTRRDDIYMWPNPYRREYWGIGESPPLPDAGFVDYLVLDRAAMNEESQLLALEVVAEWGFGSIFEVGSVIVYQRSP